jgi:hypothetical protein
VALNVIGRTHRLDCDQSARVDAAADASVDGAVPAGRYKRAASKPAPKKAAAKPTSKKTAIESAPKKAVPKSGAGRKRARKRT